MARMISTALRPSRPSTSGGRPSWIGCTKYVNCRAWPTCEIAARLLQPPEAPVLAAIAYPTSNLTAPATWRLRPHTAPIMEVNTPPPCLMLCPAELLLAVRARRDGRLEGLVGVAEARGEDRAELYLVPGAGVDDA